MFVGSKIFSGVNTIMANIAEKEKKQRIEERYREKNYEINIVTDFEDETLVGKIKEIEFDNGIKIPTLYNYTYSDDVELFLETREDNIVAKASPVVKMKYPNDSTMDFNIDMFCQSLAKQNSYKRFINLETDLKIFLKNEIDGYYSYIIVDKNNITYGVSYGIPKIKSY